MDGEPSAQKEARHQKHLRHVKRHWQLFGQISTDNGSEFLENQDEQGLPSTVRALGSDHRYIPPKRYTWQSDVETVYRLVEDEFFDRESFTGPADFWRKVTTYWHYFNLVRPNRGKEWQCPLQILQTTAPALAGAVLNWRPLNLSKRHHLYLPKPNHRGHDVPSFPLITMVITMRPGLSRRVAPASPWVKSF